jgi:hypothetical protein
VLLLLLLLLSLQCCCWLAASPCSQLIQDGVTVRKEGVGVNLQAAAEELASNH